MACRFAKRKDKFQIGKQPSQTVGSARNQHEDYFAMILHDDVKQTAVDKIKNLGLTVLAEVGEGSSLEQSNYSALSIWGHPLVTEDYLCPTCYAKTNTKSACQNCPRFIPMRCSVGNERHETFLEKWIWTGWKGSGQKERSSERIFYDANTLPGNSGSPVLSQFNKIKGIHVAGEEFNGVITNEAQKLKNIIKELKKF